MSLVGVVAPVTITQGSSRSMTTTILGTREGPQAIVMLFLCLGRELNLAEETTNNSMVGIKITT